MPTAGGETSTRVAVGEGLAEHDTLAADVETSGDGYARRFSGPVGSWFLDVQADQVLDLIEGARLGRLYILDVGGGHGQLTQPLLDRGHRIVVHGSRSVCHARLTGMGTRIGRVTSDLWRLPFASGTFDLVVGIRLLAHVEAWRELLAEMARVSRDLVLVDFPARGALHSLAPFLFGAKRRLEGNTRPYFDFTVKQVDQGLEASGFRRSGLSRQFALPMALHRALRRPALSRRLESTARWLGITRRLGSPVLCLAERVPEHQARQKTEDSERRLA